MLQANLLKINGRKTLVHNVMINHPVNNSDLSVYEYDLLPEFDFTKLASYINEYKEQYPKNYYTDGYWDGGNWWHSDYIVHYQTDKFNDLIANIEEKATSIMPSQNINVSLEVKESWIIDYKRLSFHKEHDHSPIGFSAVCYIDTVYASDIWFNKTKITPETGKLIIFPGSLKHKVSPMTNSNGHRLIMAFNLFPKINYDKLNKYIDDIKNA